MSELAAFILLDRSSSMGGARWENAIGSINQYVASLRKNEVEGAVTVVAFDSIQEYIKPVVAEPGLEVSLNAFGNVGYAKTPAYVNESTFEFLRTRSDITDFEEIKIDELSPRGSTPLYDATANLIRVAEYEDSEKTVIIIMTDGEENTSRSETLGSIRKKIELCKSRGWEVVFLGAEFNAETTARNFGLDTSKVINTSLRNVGASMNFYADASASYAKTGAAIDTMAVKADLAK